MVSVAAHTLPRIVNAFPDHGTPSSSATMRALRAAAAVLRADRCYAFRRSFHFAAAPGWTVALTPEAAGRFRVDACRSARPVSSLWCSDGEDGRLAGVVRSQAHVIRATLEAHEPIGDAHAAVPPRPGGRFSLTDR